ncbi:hypothetical protein [Arthrobacter sp. 35W]|uniref:hypothetical protein n=1 Tax=Arthrobacter sp. 35W TaxID=1132441 RepID=UPI0003FB6075|nr:hypothetical protein [Arthrobacter sp. 35W]
MISPDTEIVYFDGFELERQPGWTVMRVTDGWTANADAIAASGHVDELRLNYAWGFRESSVDFIGEWPLKKISVLAHGLVDLTPLHRLGATLEELSIQAVTKARIDLAQFPHLWSLVADWPIVEPTFNTLTGLTSLYLGSYKEADLAPIAANRGLASLRMKQHPQVRSIDGIEELAHLEKLQIVAATKLGDITAFRHAPLRHVLRELDFSNCRRIDAVDDIAFLTNLQELTLSNCGTLESLKPLAALTKLHLLDMHGSTVIADGGLTPLLEMPALKGLSLTNRRHYRPKVKQIEAALGARHEFEGQYPERHAWLTASNPSGTRDIDENEITELPLALFELTILSNCISETAAQVDEWEFHPRIGGTLEEAQALRRRIQEHLNRVRIIG